MTDHTEIAEAVDRAFGDFDDGEPSDYPGRPQDAAPPGQIELIPMSEDELRQASAELASLVLQEIEMAREHRAQRKEMADERIALRGQIEAVAGSIKKQGR